IQRKHSAGFAIVAAGNAVVLGTELNAGHIAETHSTAVRSFPHDNLPKFFRRHEAALGEHRVREFRALGSRLGPHFSGWVDRVLRLNSADDFWNGNAELGELIRLYPHTHGVLPGTEHVYDTDTIGSEQRIDKIDVG